ncbi:MAG: adenylosuccinate synthase [Bdellovibrionales bacterium]
MSASIVVGAQWGDEGKGKLVDVLASRADLVVRFQGGANAGHTLVVNGHKTVLHLIPSGILHPNTVCMITSGVVLDVFGILDEIDKLQAQGLLKKPENFLISDNCSLLMPYHKVLDVARESYLNDEKIGTTGKGIGPAYEDRTSRRGLIFSDLFQPDTLKEKIDRALLEKNALLTQVYGKDPFDTKGLLDKLASAAERLKAHRCQDTSHMILKAIKGGKKVLFEGAQGTLLDIHHGTYPFVTSSSTIAASSLTSTGIGPQNIKSIIGVFKAYVTRVGAGPFPTELLDSTGEFLRTTGHEFGSTTGRPRRCGWLDLVALKYAIRLNGITNLAMMKLDVLSGLEKIQVCTGYKINGQTVTEWPSTLKELEGAVPVLQELPGWKEDLTKITQLSELPRPVNQYLDFISDFVKTPIDVISVGPGREQTLWVKPLFNS